MDVSSLVRKSDDEWWIPQMGAMRVPGVICASDALVRKDENVREQIANVAILPGIQRTSCAMPDAHCRRWRAVAVDTRCETAGDGDEGHVPDRW